MTKIQTADLAHSLITPVDAGVLFVPLLASKRYYFRASILYVAAAATTGIGLGVNGPVGATLTAGVLIAETATTVRSGVVTALDGNVQALASAGATLMHAQLEGTMLTGTTAGNLAIRMRSEIAASAVTLKAGSFLEVRE